MYTFKRIFFLWIAGLFLSCTRVTLPVSDQQIVIEGWIEDGDYPVVMVTTTVPVSEEIHDISELQEYIVRWGKVTISDGTENVVLFGKRDDRYFPPYIYTTSRMKGKVGNTYTITVEYSGKTVTASTTIPAPSRLENVKVVRSSDNDELVSITARIPDDPIEKNYYKTFVKVFGKDSTYLPSFMGLIDDAVLDGQKNEISVNNSLSNLFESRIPQFHKSDTVTIRFCTMDEDSFMYWSDFDDVASLSRNPFFPVTSKIRSNIQGGLGYWAGYGTTFHTVSIPDSLAVGK